MVGEKFAVRDRVGRNVRLRNCDDCPTQTHAGCFFGLQPRLAVPKTAGPRWERGPEDFMEKTIVVVMPPP
jgi:hypothetical protein